MEENAFYSELIKRYKENKATTEEVEVFFHLLKEGKLDEHLVNSMDADIADNDEIKVPASIKRIPSWMRVAAAVFILLTGAVVFFFSIEPKQKEIAQTENIVPFIKDIPPGGNRAILQLADNSFIVLDSAQNGQLVQQGNVKIEKQNGQLKYTNQGQQDVAALAFNTLTTPRGGQYQLTLPDGSKVWLNAGSSIRYPVAFTGNERLVEITGESYFEVASFSREGTRIPFIVKVNNMEVQVLGTHFNIMAYNNEASVKTTLLEGAVKVMTAGNDRLLKPGQQAQLKKDGSIKIEENIDTEEAIAWKNGFFQFNSADIGTVMRQVERWYDVKIVYEGKIPGGHFSGSVSRGNNISQVLKTMQEGGVHFKIEGRKVVIYTDKIYSS